MRGEERDNTQTATGGEWGALGALRAMPWSWPLILLLGVTVNAWRRDAEGICAVVIFWLGVFCGHVHGWLELRSRVAGLLRRAFGIGGER